MLLALLGAALAVPLFAVRSGLLEFSDNQEQIGELPALSNHPVYRHYQFGDSYKVIDIGTQPLFLPGVISEVMKRDTILKSELAEVGVEARFHSFLKGADVNFFLARGDLEAGIGGDMPTLMACANSSVSVTSLIDQHFVAIVARKSMMVSELKGKRIGYGFGSNAHYALLEALASEGLGPGDVSLIPMDVNDMASSLESGSIEAFSAWEPTPTIVLHKHPEFVSIRRVLTTGYLYFSEPFKQSSPQIVRLIVASQLRAMAWIIASDENLLAASTWTLNAGKMIGGDVDDVSPELLSDIVNNGLLGNSASALIAEKSLKENSSLFREFRFLQSLGQVPENKQWDDINSCFDQKLALDIISKPEQYRLSTDDFLGDVFKTK